VERVDQSLHEQGDYFEIVVPQYDQQNADAFCNIKIFNSFGHGEISSAPIVPRCLFFALSGTMSCF
jgi:hypothetical protein